jgi:hypothetical protein
MAADRTSWLIVTGKHRTELEPDSYSNSKRQLQIF